MSSYAPTPTLETAWPVRPAIGGVPIVPTTVLQAASVLVAAAIDIAAHGDRGAHVHLASAQTIALAAGDEAMDRAVNGTGWVLPDGKPISWVSWFRRDVPRLRQTRGYDVFTAVCDLGRTARVRHFLLGSTPAVLEAMQANLESRFPGIEIVGAISPAYRAATADELRERDATIRKSGAHMVWVGLGTPKQDFEVERLAAELPVMALAVGAVFDYSAGRLSLAPRWISTVGLEWLFRLISEPRRLWRRYTVDSWRFVSAVLRHGRKRRYRFIR